MARAKITRPPSAEAIARERDALELKRAGVTYDVIADRLGFANRGSAYKAVQRALRRTLQEPADELRSIEADRLDRMQFAVWAKAMGGDLGAIDRVLRIMDRRAALLGLDVPAATGGRGAENLDAEIEALVAELASGRVGKPADHPG